MTLNYQKRRQRGAMESPDSESLPFTINEML